MTIEEITVLVKAIAIILGAIITMIIKPAIETYVDKDTFNKFTEYTKVAIRCAEQLFTPEQWAEKKDYVYNYAVLKANELNIELTAQDIDILVEGFVNEIKKGK